MNETTKTQYSPRTKIQSPRPDTSWEIASSTERLPPPGSRLPISNEPAVSSRTPKATPAKTWLTARIDGLIQNIDYLIHALKVQEKGEAFASAAMAAQRANEVLHAASDLIVEKIRPQAELLQREAKPLGEERWEVDATVVNAGKDLLELYKACITDALKHMATVITLLKKVPPAPEGQPTVSDFAKEIRYGISALDRSRAASGESSTDSSTDSSPVITARRISAHSSAMKSSRGRADFRLIRNLTESRKDVFDLFTTKNAALPKAGAASRKPTPDSSPRRMKPHISAKPVTQSTPGSLPGGPRPGSHRKSGARTVSVSPSKRHHRTSSVPTTPEPTRRVLSPEFLNFDNLVELKTPQTAPSRMHGRSETGKSENLPAQKRRSAPQLPASEIAGSTALAQSPKLPVKIILMEDTEHEAVPCTFSNELDADIPATPFKPFSKSTDSVTNTPSATTTTTTTTTAATSASYKDEKE